MIGFVCRQKWQFKSILRSRIAMMMRMKMIMTKYHANTISLMVKERKNRPPPIQGNSQIQHLFFLSLGCQWWWWQWSWLELNNSVQVRWNTLDKYPTSRLGRLRSLLKTFFYRYQNIQILSIEISNIQFSECQISKFSNIQLLDLAGSGFC